MRNDVIAILVLAIVVVACEDEAPPTAGPPAALRPISVRIDGPTSMLSLGAEVQFTALQSWSDGSARDVTATAQWTSTNPLVLSVSAGRARPLAAGEVGLTAQVEQLISQPRPVRVVPTGPEWEGQYTLTIGGGACNASLPLPPELRQRTYTASLHQAELMLYGSVRNVGDFGGHILNPQVRFTFDRVLPFGRRAQRASASEVFKAVIRLASYRNVAYSGQRGFVEVLPDRNHLIVTGDVSATMSPSGFAGTLNGALSLYETSRHTLLGVCSSTSHGFSLVRR
jgi:hypothetical protein